VHHALVVRSLPLGLVVALIPAAAHAQRPSRPEPYPVLESRAFARAVDRGTRTRSGAPGARYWQQRATYDIHAWLDPGTKRLVGSEAVHYVNASPDTLRAVAVYLRQNMFAPGAARSSPGVVTSGMDLRRVLVDSQPLGAPAAGTAPGYRVDGTIAWITLPRPIPPKGGSVDLAFDWAYTPPPSPSDGREGDDKGEVFMMGYWYPQMAVYDDVSGWETDPYLGAAEHYMGYADYEVALTLPDGWLVAATGELRNPDDVLSADARRRLAEARRTDQVIAVSTGASPGGATTAGAPPVQRVWHFRAKGVRDFAWAASNKYVWDATRAVVAPGDTVAINCLYRQTSAAAAWSSCATAARAAVEGLSRYLWPYPYSQMSAVEGVLQNGGMEYPMLTIIQSYADTTRLARNLMHEIAHMWFPMQVGSDETRYPWMDEGLAEFAAAQTYPLADRVGRGERSARQAYLALARDGSDVEIMRHGNHFPDGPDYFVIEYQKTTTVLAALRALVGDSIFHRALRAYGEQWREKHPQPEDFFNAMNTGIGKDLWWFWRSWFFETWTLDQRLSATRSGSRTTIVVEDSGLVPMPARIRVRRADGSEQKLEVPVDVWLRGARRGTVTVPSQPAITTIEIDAGDDFPYVDRQALRWPR